MRRYQILFALVLAGAALPARAQLNAGDSVRLRGTGPRDPWRIGVVGRLDTMSLWLRFDGDTALTAVPSFAIGTVQRRDEVEVADALWLNWAIAVGSLVVGAYVGANAEGCDSTAKDVLCGIGGALVGGWLVGTTLGPMWPTHTKRAWVTVRLPLPARSPGKG